MFRYRIGQLLVTVREALAGRPQKSPAKPVSETTQKWYAKDMSKPPQLWYPKAEVVEPELPTLGDYENGYPRGAVIHYTAGAYGLSELDLARQLGYAYLLIDERGKVHQGFPLNRWGSHAGKSSWPTLRPNGVSRYLVGIEVDCAGKLATIGNGKFASWWGSQLPADNVRLIPEGRENQVAGAYHAFTDEQEASLTELLIWLKSNNPDVFDLDLVLGHDEVSPGRKEDPGGSLSMTMPQYRAYLKMRYREAAGSGTA